jgi:hypothetical protein
MKVNFILVYVAPWNLSWGSAVHAILQPLGVPRIHCYVYILFISDTSLAILQVLWSSFIAAPLYPFIGRQLIN